MANTTKKTTAKKAAPAKAVKTAKTTKTTKTAKPAPKASKATAAKAAAEAKAAATFMVHSAPVKNVVEDAPLYFEKKLPQKDTLQVGYPLEKVDAMGLVTGTQKYVEDIDMPQNLLHVKVLGSPYAHAEIKKIDVEEAKKMPGVVVVYTYKDLPRVMRTTAGQGFPEPSPYDTPTLAKKVGIN